jgi:hypothetical protein
MASGRYVQPAMLSDLHSRPHKRATDRDDGDGLAALTSAERHHHKLEKPDEASPISTIAC